MKHPYLKYGLLILSFATLLGMTGCSTVTDDTKVSEEKTSSLQGAQLILTLNAATSSRTVNTTINGVDAENAINTASVFFVNSTSNVIMNVVNFSNLSNATTLTLSLDDYDINLGSYKLYVITNLSSTTASGFKGQNISTLEGNISSVSDVIGASSSNFVMSGEALDNGGGTTLVFTDKGITYTAAVNLRRIVAKVLVTATATKNASDNNYYITDPNGNAGAFIKVSDISFSLLTTNKSFYYFQQHNALNAVVDLNYEMDNYLSSTDQFMNPSTTKIAQIYDEDKINANSAEYISNSIYCLENTTDQSTSFATWTSPVQLANAQKVATYVKVTLNGATPRIIDGTTYATATAAKAVLTGGKFYTYLKGSTDAERILCFSSKDLVAAHFGVSVDDAFIQEHSVSDTYNFYTFVNGKTFSASSSSVLRNNYYILDITEISTPYLSKIMEINTKVTGWSLKGTTTQNVDTSGTTE